MVEHIIIGGSTPPLPTNIINYYSYISNMIDIKENSKVIAEFMGIHVLKGETTDADGNPTHYYYYNDFEEQDYNLPPYSSQTSESHIIW